MTRHPAFTLIELLIFMGIVSVFMVILGQLVVSAVNTRLETEGSGLVEQESLFLISRLTYDIHRAGSITIPAASGAVSPTLSLVINGQTYTYAVSSGRLYLTAAGNSQPLSSYNTTVNQISFHRLGLSTNPQTTVSIDFTLTSNTLLLNQKAFTQTYHTTLGTR